VQTGISGLNIHKTPILLMFLLTHHSSAIVHLKLI